MSLLSTSASPVEIQPMAGQRALLFVNAKASQTEGMYERIEQALSKGGLRVERAEASCGADCALRVKERAADADLIVVAGGDGTVCAAADATLQATKGRLPVGIVPLGTANNVARSLGIPIDVEGACDVISAGRMSEMDLAKVNGETFVSVTGLGLSTQVHDQVPPEHKKRWGSLAYAAHALRILFSKPAGFRAEIRLPDRVHRVKALQITVCNGRYYGAHVQVQSEATLMDGMLDISIIEAAGYWKGLFKALLPLPTGHRSPGLRLLQAPRLEIVTRHPMKLDVEGTAGDLTTPATFEVMPKALRVFTPPVA